MRRNGLLLIFTLMTAAAAVAQDPFLGTWVYSTQKSPKPTITYGIKDLGTDRYALTGSTGETTEIKADGVSIKSPSGATVSFKKLDDHTWQMNRVDNRTMVRTYTVSPDDKNLTLVDVFTAANGGHDKTTTTYTRTSAGNSIFGEWRSISMEEESASVDTMTIATYGKAGFSVTSSFSKHETDLELDGKPYPDKDPDSSKVQSSSGKRVDAHHVALEGQVDGKPDDTEDWKVSEDGKTLTIVSKSAKTASVFTSVWDKQ